MTASLFAVAACGDVYDTKALKGDISGDISSNGGFAVEKGDYIYYINGKQTNTADNTFGEVETGAVMRISKKDLDSRNYANAETVVPEIVHSGNNNGGLFIYGDYVYYSTPSSAKNSDGEIQNSTIRFKSAKLDGTEVMKGYYAQYTNNNIEYRFVEAGEDKTVYLLYVATSEDYYKTGNSYTNLHSVNTKTGKDTLLAYNISSYMFDKDVTNPRVYYTMNVKDYVLDIDFNSYYNQIYTVSADATTPNEYDFSDVKDFDKEKDPLYVNCGDLVLDGIGMIQGKLTPTQFNADIEDGEDKVARSPYKYTLSHYENGTLFYTRTSTNNSTAMLFAVNEDEVFFKDGHRPAIDNPEDYLLIDGSNAGSYTYIFDGSELTGAFIADNSGLIKTVVENGKLLTEVDNSADSKTYYLETDGTPTVLFVEGNYIYYSESGNGANGYIIKRLDYTGGYKDYNRYSETDGVNPYTPVRILDLDCTSDWYLPEMFDGKILFSSETETMNDYADGTNNYSHIMVCDITGENGIMSNEELDGLNKTYEKIKEIIDDVDESDYEHLKNAYWYAHFTGDVNYIDTIIKAYVDIGEDVEMYWSKETVEKVKNFFATDGEWAELTGLDTTVNGEKVYANQRDYYYALLGKMTKSDKKAYTEFVRNTYLKELPEEEESWFEGLSKGAKAGFIIGIIAGALIIIAAGTVVTIVIIRKRKAKLPTYTKKRVKVDTTDDNSVDVYATDEPESQE